VSEYTIDWKPRKTCCVYDANEPSGHCEKPWFARGRCREHWHALRILSPSEREQEIERAGMPIRKSFEWTGDEKSLAEKYGKNDELTGEKQ
jgi:hypothetical protein